MYLHSITGTHPSIAIYYRSRDILIANRSTYGFAKDALNLLYPYFNGRKQRTVNWQMIILDH